MLTKAIEIINGLNEGETFSTKEIAGWLGIPTKKAYKICSELHDSGLICKFGYRVEFSKGMGTYEWHEDSKRRSQSLHWQVSLRS
jgi:DNA-binding IclR family transcriptional regulator